MREWRLKAGIFIAIVLALALLYQYGYSGIRDRMALLKEEREMKIETLRRYQKILGQREGLQEELKLLRKALQEQESGLLPGETPSLASANLQEKIKSVITANGGRVRSERVGKTVQYGPYREITVIFNLEFDGIEPLLNLLYSIESDPTLLVIKELNIRVKNFRRPGTLVVMLKVGALAR